MKLISIALLGCAACLLSAAVDGAAAQGWHSAQRNNQPMVTGSGRIVRQARAVGAFRHVDLRGFANVEIRLGARPSLTIEADDNLLPYLASEVRGGTLVLDTRGSIRTRRTPRIYLTAPDLESVLSSGSGNVAVTGVSNRHIALRSRGSGNLRAQGRTGHLEATIQGSGDADLRALAAGQADVSVVGSGNAWIASSGAVRARSFGSGNVYVLGRPSSLDVRQGGSGRVIRSR